MYEKEQISFNRRQQASNALFVSPRKTAQATNKVPQHFDSRLSSQLLAMSTETRSELRASSPASWPSSSPRRGRGA